jgi:hypothetical protein
MIRDLRSILDGWDYEPGKISVRKIIGRDGREKIQTRIDLGVLQLEPHGRPDGLRPHNCDTLVAYHEQRLERHLRAGEDREDFVLTPEDARELRHEAYLFYQRYLSCFVLEEWDAVETDTLHNLRLMDLLHACAATENDRNLLEPQRAYVIMMNARALAYRALQRELFDEALAAIEGGMRKIRNLPRAERSGDEASTTELNVLYQLQKEVILKMPDDAPARLRFELATAVASEDYERAASLRDRLAATSRR